RVSRSTGLRRRARRRPTRRPTTARAASSSRRASGSSGSGFSVIAEKKLFQPAAARHGASPGEGFFLAVEEADSRLHLRGADDLLPFFDEAGAYAYRRRIEDQGQLHRQTIRVGAMAPRTTRRAVSRLGSPAPWHRLSNSTISAIQARFISPPTNNGAIGIQQQPRQNRP